MYTTWGSVRGGCGHAHKTIETASACCHRDHVGARQQGGHSDRQIREIDSRADLVAYDTRTGPGRQPSAEDMERQDAAEWDAMQAEGTR